jgi:hypothetical protein
VKVKIRLDTGNDAVQFSNICSKLDGKITVTDNNGLRINAKPLLGMIYALEFEELWCESSEDIYMHIIEFVVID